MDPINALILAVVLAAIALAIKLGALKLILRLFDKDEADQFLSGWNEPNEKPYTPPPYDNDPRYFRGNYRGDPEDRF